MAKRSAPARKGSSNGKTPAPKASGKSAKPAPKGTAKPSAKAAAKPAPKAAAKPAPPKGKPAAPAAKAKPKAAGAAKAPAPKPAPPSPKAAPPKGAPAKSAPAKSAPAKSAPPKGPAKPEVSGDGKKVPAGRKGITVVSAKPATKKSGKPGIIIPTVGSPLIRPGAPAPKPLIQSGPKAPARHAGLEDSGKPHKTPFDKKALERFRQILLRKRSELVRDVSTMETEALQGQSGSLSHLPQHMAEQGSDAYDQSLALDLAAADRRLVREIDDALKRIDEGTFGVCELTGKPIKLERLEELPWARYSIEAARELERRSSIL